MALLSREDLKALVGPQKGPCVSIFMPTHRAGGETQQDPIRLKNLLREAEDRLVATGLRALEAKRILKPARRLLDDTLFWRYQSDGLAVFLARNGVRSYRLPLALEELVVVARHFHVKPLLPAMLGDGPFYVLALSQNEVRLLHGTREGLGQIDLTGVPGSLAEALKYDEPQRQLQLHTGTRAGTGAIFHGHEPADDLKDDLRRYFRQVAKGLEPVLNGQNAPLVLAAVEYLFPLYREANTYPHLLDGGIPGNPDGLRAEELHARAWEIIEPIFLGELQKARARYEELKGSHRTSTDLKEVLLATHQGRVDSLFVALGVRRWGVFDFETSRLELHDEMQPGDEDLPNLAALHTIVNRGTVYALALDRMPDGAEVAAAYRY